MRFPAGLLFAGVLGEVNQASSSVGLIVFKQHPPNGTHTVRAEAGIVAAGVICQLKLVTLNRT